MRRSSPKFRKFDKVVEAGELDPIKGIVLRVRGPRVQVEHLGRGFSRGDVVRSWGYSSSWEHADPARAAEWAQLAAAAARTVERTAVEAISLGLSDEEVLAAVLREHPNARTTSKGVATYRTKARAKSPAVSSTPAVSSMPAVSSTPAPRRRVWLVRYANVLTGPDGKPGKSACGHLHKTPAAAYRCRRAMNRATGAEEDWRWGTTAYKTETVESDRY